MVTISGMPRGKKAERPAATEGDRHKPRFMVGIPEEYRPGLDVLVSQNPGSDRTDFVRIAVKEFLERAGLWPPKGSG